MKPKKSLFRILCITLILTLLITVICGCDKTQDTASQSSVASSSQTVSSIQEEPKYGETTVDYLNKTRVLGRFPPRQVAKDCSFPGPIPDLSSPLRAPLLI